MGLEIEMTKQTVLKYVTKKEEGFECSCITDFELAADGKNCVLAHPCDRRDNGGCTQKCTKNGTEHTCGCHNDFELDKDGFTCNKVHPCDKPNKGGCEDVCEKEGEEAVCACTPPGDYLLASD